MNYGPPFDEIQSLRPKPLTVKVFADCCVISLRFGNPKSAGKGETGETERREREGERERARDPVAIVAKIGKD